MTHRLLEDFETRHRETELFFRYVLIAGKAGASWIPTVDEQPFTSSESEDVFQTIKASALLLLYNLVESTATALVEAIFDEIRDGRHALSDVRREIRSIVYHRLKERTPEGDFVAMQDVAVEIVSVGFDRTKLFSGNVDARKIRETARRYGFSAEISGLRVNTEHLLTVKNRRNALTHGAESFVEVGRNYTPGELMDIERHVASYLDAIVKNVVVYLETKQYLVSHTPPNAPLE